MGFPSLPRIGLPKVDVRFAKRDSDCGMRIETHYRRKSPQAGTGNFVCITGMRMHFSYGMPSKARRGNGEILTGGTFKRKEREESQRRGNGAEQ